MKVAIYTRVSTDKQDYENQLIQLREYCKKKSFEISVIYRETISGKEHNRPEFKQMMSDASKQKFDAILVWALDRFTREGVDKVWKYIKELDYHGIEFISYQEPFLNTDNKMVKDMLFSIMGVLAEQERIRISERTKTSLLRYKRQIEKNGYFISKEGKKVKALGRPSIKNVDKKIIEAHNSGMSMRQISKTIYYWTASNNKRFVSLGYVHKVIKNLGVGK